MADIEIGHRGCLASLWVSDVALVSSMERAGYTVSDQTGERSLRGLDEVAAEREMLERAVARPVTPVYSELSQILQVSLHRALTRQQDPRPALQDAAGSMRRLLAKTKLAPPR